MKKLLHFRFFLIAIIVSSSALPGCGKVVETPRTPANFINMFGGEYIWPSFPASPSDDTLFKDAIKYIKVERFHHYCYKDSVSGNIDTVRVILSGEEKNSATRYLIQMANSNGLNSRWFVGSLTAIGRDSIMRMNSNWGVVFEFYRKPGDNKIVDNIVIENVTYNNVLVSTTVDPVSNKKVVALWTPGVGLIKMTTVTPSVTNVITLVKHW